MKNRDTLSQTEVLGTGEKCREQEENEDVVQFRHTSQKYQV